MTTIQKKYSSCERLKIAVEYDSEKSSVSLSDQITAHSLPLRETDESSKILRWNVLEATSFLDNRSLVKQLEEKEYEIIDWLGLKKFPASSQSSRKNRIY
ncbi:hypothetical protein PV325_000832 [Microctonus aethiopoides]|nr:hypothetical protein PV325_000832 [Microctonus aethiopoides]KAK0087913.1 hypothetical protein PV326_004994 [Microctonus aethiopoides]